MFWTQHSGGHFSRVARRRWVPEGRMGLSRRMVAPNQRHQRENCEVPDLYYAEVYIESDRTGPGGEQARRAANNQLDEYLTKKGTTLT